MIVSVFQKFWVLGILGPPFCGIGATIRIGREIRCLPYAGFFYKPCIASLFPIQQSLSKLKIRMYSKLEGEATLVHKPGR